MVTIDTNYKEGEAFKVVYNDIPPKKKDYIKGEYEVVNSSKIAIKILDMIGEEFLYIEE